MLRHGKKVSFFVTGQDSKGNEIASGRVQLPHNPLELLVVSDQRLHQIGMLTLSPISFEEFEPVIDATNSTILGHDDRKPLHPGISM